jgi:4-aminobutyrate aminotransferase-like enzyme/Ser/Thr protein kinase RdoA (MazF antagonist)
VSSVLESAPPRFSAEEAAAIAAELFGVHGDASDLGSERDQAFRLEGGVLKISNSGEDPAALDLEEAAIAHVAAVDPALPVARPLAPRATFDGHHVRLFELGHGHKAGPELPDSAVQSVAEVHARLCLALRSFFHPAAGRELLWNVHATPQLRPLLEEIADQGRRRLVTRTIDRFEARVLPEWQRLRGQVVHGDFNLDNLLLDERGRVAAILDFGDCCHTALAADVAVALASILRGRPLEDAFRVARISLDGFAVRFPLEPLELELLGDLVAARLAAIVSISAWRTRRFPENSAYIEAWDDDSWRLLELLDELGPEEVARELGAQRGPTAGQELAQRRQRTLGALLTPLTYARPVHAVRAEGVWIYEPEGRLLDAYNNVPVVGHCHPRVTAAVVRQTRLGATNARYLAEPLVELAERLLATFPQEAGLDTVLLVNSGSEANDLAWRLAAAATGHGGRLVTENAYHGVTAATTALSPEDWPPDSRPSGVARIPPPGCGADLAGALDTALGELEGGLAATFLDGSLMSDGIFTPEDAELRLLVERTHAAGGLYVADEVQAGHGRLGGPDLWSFARHGIAPDLVTLGKPMGNGYPVAAVVTRRDLAARFPYAGRTFSTFGGNPVAASAALAVLDVLRDERLPERAAEVGERLRAAIEGLGNSNVVEVRGRGLLAGVQLSSAGLARRVADALRERGILVGLTGKHDDTLKIRPPLVFADEHAELLVAALEGILG